MASSSKESSPASTSDSSLEGRGREELNSSLLDVRVLIVNCRCQTRNNLMFQNCLRNRVLVPNILFGLNFGFVKSVSTHINKANQVMAPFLIGICGGTASGKTTVCQKIIQELGQEDIPAPQRRVVCIAQDSFYRHLTEKENIEALQGKFNFDSPDALDFKLMTETIDSILLGKKTKIPVYDFTTNSRKPGEFVTIYPADVVLFEGILVFHYKTILNSFHMKVFVDTDSDIRLSRRIIRDVEERGRDFEHVINQYTRTVKPAFDEYCMPTKRFADIILPGGDNRWGITLIVQHIKELLLARNRQLIEPMDENILKTYANGVKTESFNKGRNGIH